MRYPEAHAARSGSVPFMLRGPKAVRTVLSGAVAVAIGLTPALVYATPASAALGDIVITPSATSVTEGGTVSFTLANGTPSAAGTYSIAVVADTGPHPATVTSNTDVSQPSTTSFTDSQLPVAFTVATTVDTLYEYNETFKVVVSQGGVTSAEQVITINDDDTAPTYTLSATPTSVTEAPGASTTITATLSKLSGRDTVVTVNTVDGTAVGGNDFTALVNQTITIAPNVMSNTRTLNIANDGFKDTAATETLTVIGNATNVVSGQELSSVGVSIVDAQAGMTPKLTIGGGDGTEGGNSTFTVTATPGSELPISASWASVETTPASGHGVAVAGVDFTYPSTRTVNITPRTTTADIVIPLTTDTIDEPDEDFTVELSGPTNSELGTPSKKTATITDATNAPGILSITPTAVEEGNSGTKTATFTATLSAASAKTVKANWSTADGTATAGLDYVAANGTLTFAPGSTAQTFDVKIIGDTIDEGVGETFTVSASSTDGSLTASGPTSLTITDDDAKPTITFPDVSISEGNETWAKLIPVKLSNASDHAISFSLAAASVGTTSNTLTSTVGSGDYSLLNNSVTIPAGQTNGYAVVLVNGDMIYEPNEAVDLTATVSAGALGADYVGTGSPATSRLTLGNDDKAPDLEINSAKGKEGDTVKVTGTVTGVSQDNTTLTVSFAGKAVDGHPAASESDFTNPGAQVVTITPTTIPGTTRSIASIPLVDDAIAEPAEAIVGSGTGLGGVGTVTDGVILIEASDGGTTPEEPGEAPKPTIMAKPTKVVGPGPVEIEGKVAAGKQVQLWSATVGGGALKWVKNVTADDEGYYWFKQDITWGTRFATLSQGVKSNEIAVWVTQDPVFVVSTTSKGQLNLGVKGMPWAAGQTAAVQQWKNGGWVTMWSGKTGADGVWRASPKFASGTTVTLRAWVGGEPGKGTLPAFTDQIKSTVK